MEEEKRSVGDAILYALCQAPNGGYVGAGFAIAGEVTSSLREKPNQGGGNWNNCIIGDMSVAGIYDITLQ